MNNLPQPHQSRSWLTELSEAFSGLPAWLRPMTADTLRLEEEVCDGHYLVHAEIPGIDPAKDVDVTVCDNRLTIKAERSERKQTGGRSEFSYGSFLRTITLPPGSDADNIKASYDKGILTVDIAVPKQAAPEVKHVTVTAGT